MTQSKSDAAVNPDQQADRAAETKQALLTTIGESDDASREHNQDLRWKTGLASGEDWWVWELAGLVISAVALVCIFVLLRRYDNKQQPEWAHLSLNTAVALLSTLGKASVLIAVSRGLGQLKWIWLFNTERSLADLQFRPSTTQIAHVTNSTSYKAVGPNIGGSLYYIDSSMKANLYGSILSPNATQQWGVPAFICSIGDCTWDPVATLAIRPLCSDITSMLETSCSIFNSTTEGELEPCFVSLNGSRTLSFTNDPSLGRISMNMTVTGLGTGSTLPPIVYDNQTFPVIRYVSAIGTAIGLPGTSPEPVIPLSHFVATECALEPYVVSVQPKVNKSVYSEVILDEWSLTNTFSEMNITSDEGLTFHPPWGPELGMGRDQPFTMSFTAWNSVGLAIIYMFNGSIQTAQPIGDGSGTSADRATGGTIVIVDQQVQYYPTSEVVLYGA
ncbi:hypothetical protein N0V83_001662 [Neocucurbitaria cava]|uniref:Uncharacterized protein n=1 Tax=Neocucurbitaria cava TaxID=798079 RepID=A0A9W8YHK9_9PLEO|nr:hypothetical protein N0V83_001662 [Neocucurbitaria cava]